MPTLTTELQTKATTRQVEADLRHLAMPRLTLLSRAQCHLCDVMKTALDECGAGTRFELDVVDIDGKPEFLSSWSDKVPVLFVGSPGAEILSQYRLNASALEQYLVSVSR